MKSNQLKVVRQEAYSDTTSTQTHQWQSTKALIKTCLYTIYEIMQIWFLLFIQLRSPYSLIIPSVNKNFLCLLHACGASVRKIWKKRNKPAIQIERNKFFSINNNRLWTIAIWNGEAALESRTFIVQIADDFIRSEQAESCTLKIFFEIFTF